MTYDAVIIGAGPAGLSCAVYLKRAMLSVAVIEKQPFSGGQMLYTEEIENYLGFESITGNALSEKFKDHAKNMGAEFIKGDADCIENGNVKLKDGRIISAKVIVIATGSAHKKLDVKGEQTFAGRGVSYCATCDGAFFTDKEVAVIGGGDTAIEDAIYLSNICSRVTLIHRRKELRAAKILSEKFLSLPNTEVLYNEETAEFQGENQLSKIVLKSGKELKVNGAFVAVGQAPQAQFAPPRIKNNQGYIITDDYCKTSMDAVFAIGDVREKNCRQIVTAVADGAIACKGILNYLNK